MVLQRRAVDSGGQIHAESGLERAKRHQTRVYFEGVLAQPHVDARWNFYRDIAVLAVPDQSNGVPVSEIIDLSQKLDGSGKLNWEVPAGTWKILRFGRTTTGEGCHPAPPELMELECDKLDQEGVDAHFDGFVSKVLTNAEWPATGRSLCRVFIDSYEVGDQDWSPSFRAGIPEAARLRPGAVACHHEDELRGRRRGNDQAVSAGLEADDCRAVCR